MTMDPSGGVRPPKSKSRSRGPSAAASSPAPRKAKTYPKDSIPVITKCRRAPNSQPRKQQHALCKEEKFMASRQVPVKKVPKRVLKADSDKDEDDEEDESDFQLEDFSTSDEEREVVIKNARKRLRQLLAETTFLVDELEKMENDVERLQDEKEGLLEQLFACEGFAVDPYPRFRPLTRKIKLLRTNL